MTPLGIQWGNSPTVTFAQTCSGPNGPCDFDKLTEQWINRQAVKDLATPPLSFDSSWGTADAWPDRWTIRRARASDAIRLRAPTEPILAEFGPNGALLKLDLKTHPETAQSLRMMYFGQAGSSGGRDAPDA